MTTLESEREMTRDEIADYLREFASQLETSEGGSPLTPDTDADENTRITFLIGDDSHTIDPPDTVTFEVEFESDSSFVGTQTEHEVEFELSWKSETSDEDSQEELEIE